MIIKSVVQVLKENIDKELSDKTDMGKYCDIENLDTGE